MATTIPHFVTIEGLFSMDSRCFKIPPYQRAYSWDKRNLEVFFNDLEEQVKRGDKYYYLGHFLFEQIGGEEYAIIDGQQRLTTTIIFISCIFKLLKINCPKSFMLDYQTIKYLNFNEIEKLRTVEYDALYFQQSVIRQLELKDCDKPETASQLRIEDAIKFFLLKLNTKKEDELILYFKVLTDAQITTHVVEDKPQAVQIFEFQNDRGKGLTNLERLKSFFMHQIYLESTKENIVRDSLS